MAYFSAEKEADLLNLMDKNSNRAGAAAAMHDEFCKLSVAEKATTLVELLLPKPNSHLIWSLAENGRGDTVGMKPPEKDIVISFDCSK